MKKFAGLMLLCLAAMFTFSACSDDDELPKGESMEQLVVGTWDVVWAEQDGESLDVPKGYVWASFESDHSYKVQMFDEHYIGTYTIDGKTVVGTTLDPITEYFKFTSIDGKNAEIDYRNSTQERMKFKAIKR